MTPVRLHAGVELPLQLGVALAILGIGALVFAVVALDIYRYET